MSNPAYRSCEDDQFAYVAYADVLWGDQGGTVAVTISSRPEPEKPCGNVPRDWVAPVCESFTTAGGEVVFTRIEAVGERLQHAVEVSKPDGTLVEIVVGNRVTRFRPGWPSDAESLPLNLDQLQTIASDPRMTLFP